MAGDLEDAAPLSGFTERSWEMLGLGALVSDHREEVGLGLLE